MKLNTSSKENHSTNMIKGLRNTMTLKTEKPNPLIITNCTFPSKTELRMVRNPDHALVI